MTNEFQIGDKKFKCGKLDAFRQFHIVRRIGPLLSDLFPALGRISKTQKELAGLSEEEKFDEIAEAIGPILEGFSKLSDADSEYVLYRLLSVVEVQQPEYNGAWAKVSTDTQLIMQTLELPVLLQAAGRSLMFNMSGFFALLPQK